MTLTPAALTRGDNAVRLRFHWLAGGERHSQKRPARGRPVADLPVPVDNDRCHGTVGRYVDIVLQAGRSAGRLQPGSAPERRRAKVPSHFGRPHAVALTGQRPRGRRCRPARAGSAGRTFPRDIATGHRRLAPTHAVRAPGSWIRGRVQRRPRIDRQAPPAQAAGRVRICCGGCARPTTAVAGA